MRLEHEKGWNGDVLSAQGKVGTMQYMGGFLSKRLRTRFIVIHYLEVTDESMGTEHKPCASSLEAVHRRT